MCIIGFKTCRWCEVFKPYTQHNTAIYYGCWRDELLRYHLCNKAFPIISARCFISLSGCSKFYERSRHSISCDLISRGVGILALRRRRRDSTMFLCVHMTQIHVKYQKLFTFQSNTAWQWRTTRNTLQFVPKSVTIAVTFKFPLPYASGSGESTECRSDWAKCRYAESGYLCKQLTSH